MDICLTQGVVLHTAAFQDRHQIATLFTLDYGVCKLFCPYSLSKRSPFFGCFSPMHQVEASWKNSVKELSRLLTASLLSTYPAIRTSFEVLQTGCGLLKAVAASQIPFKPAPLLFDLLVSYFTLLPLAQSPAAILASFQLKILRHEGLLSCDETFLDSALIHNLAFSTSANLLKELSLPNTLAEKISRAFYERIAS